MNLTTYVRAGPRVRNLLLKFPGALIRPLGDRRPVAIAHPAVARPTGRQAQPTPVILADVHRVGRHPEAELPEDVLEKVAARHGPVPARFAPKDQVPRLPGRAAGMEQRRQRVLDLAKIRWAVLIRSLHRC